MYLNKVTIIGNLTRDPELKALPNGTHVGNMSIATNRTWKDTSGAKQEAVEYHNVTIFGKQADVISQYCKKGDSILVEGRLQTRSWDDKDGKKQYKTEIMLETFQFGNKLVQPNPKTTQVQAQPTVQSLDELVDDYPEDKINLEDIPF